MGGRETSASVRELADRRTSPHLVVRVNGVRMEPYFRLHREAGLTMVRNWYRAARMGNACGAIVVTRHGCANFMPYEEEALAFVEERGGF